MKITPEDIKKITEQMPREDEMTYGEIQAIQKAANGETFALLCYAYALGFARGSAKDMV